MKTGLVRQVIQSFLGLEHRQTITRLLYAVFLWRAALITDWQLIFILALISIGFIGIPAIGRLMNVPTNINFNVLVKETLNILHGRIPQSAAMATVQENLPTVHGDYAHLLEVLQNLIDNACKFMGGQGSPRIEIGQDGFEGEMPVLYVRYNGIGIQAEFHENIFGPFRNLDVHSEVIGVWLTLVRRIVEFHNVRIWVDSEADRATTFFLTLPKASHR